MYYAMSIRKGKQIPHSYMINLTIGLIVLAFAQMTIAVVLADYFAVSFVHSENWYKNDAAK